MVKAKSSMSARRSSKPEKPLAAPFKNIGANVMKAKNNGPADSSVLFKRGKLYHQMKRDVLAGFIARLLIKKRWEDLCESLDDEVSMVEIASPDVSNGRRRDLTLGMITEELRDNASEKSYQDDWRTENQTPEGSEGSDSE